MELNSEKMPSVTIVIYAPPGVDAAELKASIADAEASVYPGEFDVYVILDEYDLGEETGRSTGVKNARTELITYMEPGELWEPDYLRIRVEEYLLGPDPYSWNQRRAPLVWKK